MQPDRFVVARHWLTAAEQDLQAARELSRYPDALGADITTAFKSDEALTAINRAQRVVAYVAEAVTGEEF